MGVITAWIAELIIITMRDTKKGASNEILGFPLPADYLASFVIYGVLGALPPAASTFAGVTAWGFTIATFLNFVDPTLSKQSTSSSTTSTASPPTSATAVSPTPAVIPNAQTTGVPNG